MDTKSLSIAVAAGVASVLAVYSALFAGAAAIPLLALAALPIYISALAWGTFAGAAASVTAIVASAFIISPQAAIIIGLGLTIPASIIGHQANLAQEDENGKLEWYPLSQILFNFALILALAILTIGYVLDYESFLHLPDLQAAVEEYFKRFPPPTPLGEEQLAQFVQSLFRTLPFMLASFWLIVHVVNLQIAALICRASGIMPRPKDDIAATVTMPKAGLPVLGACIVGIFLFPGLLHWVAIVFCGTFLTAYALVGLATNHLRARLNPVSLVFLIVCYVLIALFYIPLFLFAIGGILRSISNSTTSPPNAGTSHS